MFVLLSGIRLNENLNHQTVRMVKTEKSRQAMKELTKAEEQVMQYLWKIEKGFVKDIVGQFYEPKPAYTTITTVIRVLVRKGFIGFRTYGKVHEYYPLISKKEYSQLCFNQVVRNYFSNSYQKFASFFTRESDLSLSELEEIKKIIENRIAEKGRRSPVKRNKRKSKKED